MELKSPQVEVARSAESLCEYLSDVRNFEELMPDSISKFEVIDESSFVFALKGMPEIGLKLQEVDAPHKVVLGAISDKLPFTLSGNIESVNESSSKVQLVFEGSFNPMMSMMIKGPISSFIETLANNLKA
jgi:carbon monoxide dehydrogenase subunit G